jgi:L-asparaginase
MSRIVVLGAGGTIASAPTTRGASATRSVAEVVGALTVGDLEIVTADVLTTGSYLMTLGDMRTVASAVREALSDRDVRGVVVTHGTDTLEETAFLVDLVHDDDRPVVFTGAQRMAATAQADGADNLRGAVRLAASSEAVGRGVLVYFAGSVLAARGVRKVQTQALQAFGPTVGTALGTDATGGVRLQPGGPRVPARPMPGIDLDGVRVDMVLHYPGADSALLDAAVSAGARGVIVAGTGVGNTNPSIVQAVRRATDAGVAVGLSTRVPFGAVDVVYGNGGGFDVVEAGAIALGALPAPQARVLFAILLAETGRVDASEVALYAGLSAHERVESRR